MTSTTNPRRLARIIGALYLLLVILGPIAFLVGKTGLVVSGDPAATAANIGAHEAMFRAGMAVAGIIFLAEIVISAMLYVLFRPVSRHWSMAATLARVGLAVVQGINLAWSALALSLVSGAAYLSAFQADQLDALTQLFMDVDAFMVLVWGLFFGLHLAILGWLVHRSGFLPRLLGWMLAIGSIGYLLQSFGAIVAPDAVDLLATLVIVLSVPGELGFAIWLVVRGVDLGKWTAQTANVS
jgi:hypothetical protein